MISSKGLRFALASVHVRQQMSQMATGTSDSMRNISQENVGAVLVPLPPLAEQEAIVEAVEDQLSVVDEGSRSLIVFFVHKPRSREALVISARGPSRRERNL